MSDADNGLYNKYLVLNRETGKEAEGDYFILKPETDAAARTALMTYAAFTDNVQLAVDIRNWVKKLEEEAPKTDRYFKFVGPDGDVSGLFRSNDEKMIEDQRQKMQFAMIRLAEISKEEFLQRAREMEL